MKSIDRPVTPNRYVVPADPNGDVHNTWGGYYIDRGMWDRWMREGRRDWADHDFVIGGSVTEPGIPPEWGRSEAWCRNCGEHRLVFAPGVEMAVLNHGWCIPSQGKPRRRMTARQLANRLSVALVLVVALGLTVVGWRMDVVIPMGIITLASLVAWRISSAPLDRGL